jgi:hypothetical protein
MTGSPTAMPGGAFVRDEAGKLWFNDGAKWLGRDGAFD